MKKFDFLKESPYFAKHIFSGIYDVYVYTDYESSNGYIQIPTNERYELVYDFGSESELERTPTWFQNLVNKSLDLLEKRDRLRKLFIPYNQFPVSVDPSLKIQEIAIPSRSLHRLHSVFLKTEDKTAAMKKLKNFSAKIIRGNLDSFRLFTPVLTENPSVGLHPLVAAGFPADFEEFNALTVELIKK